MEKKRDIKRWLKQFTVMLLDIYDKVTPFLLILVLIFVIFVCVQAFSLCIVYFEILNGEKINSLLIQFIGMWHTFPQNVMDEAGEIKTRIEFLMNLFVAISGLFLSIVTFVSYTQKVYEARKKSCFRKFKIEPDSGQDLEIMRKYYRYASYVAVFSQSFKWVSKDKKMKELLTNLAKKGKLNLYTGRGIDVVKKNLKKCDKKLIECVKESHTDFRCSYIENNNAKYLLYRHEEEGITYVVVVHNNQESQYLFQVLSELVKQNK